MSSVIKRRHAANRFGVDYRAQATELESFSFPIIDVHSHINGQRSAEIYREAARAFGIGLTYSMTSPGHAEAVKDVLGESVRFIVMADVGAKNIRHAVTDGFVERIHEMRKHGAGIVKFWAAPRGLDFGEDQGFAEALRIDSGHNIDTMRQTQDLGMMAMVHVGDPDTWFTAKYADAARYGSKQEQFERFESVLDRFSMPFIAAHFGGWPENLEFLDGLLSRNSNLYLDTSATKWMVRELGRHSTDSIHAFFEKWNDRLLFGSDVVVTDAHLTSGESTEAMAQNSATENEAFDLYASRYWALRTLFETTYRGESPIADPDLAMLEPNRFNEFDAPMLLGKQLDQKLLRNLYHDAAQHLLDPYYRQ